MGRVFAPRDLKPDGFSFRSEFSPVGAGVGLISHPNQICHGSGFCSMRPKPDHCHPTRSTRRTVDPFLAQIHYVVVVVVIDVPCQ
jgi:hypothetical protein